MNREQRMVGRLRGQRVASEDQRKALRGGGAPQRLQSEGMGSLQYREDVGYKMTDEQYGEHQKRYTAWDEQLKGYTSELSKAGSQISTASKRLGAEKSAREKEIDAAKVRLDQQAQQTMGSLYSKARSGWTNVRVVDPSGHNIEATYKIPKSAIGKLTEMGNDYAWVDGGKNFNLSVVNSGRIRGAETHAALRNAERSLKETFYEKNLPAYTKSRQEIAAGYGTLNKARANLISSYERQLSDLNKQRSTIKGKQQEIGFARSEYEDTVNQARTAYEEKRAKRRALLGA